MVKNGHGLGWSMTMAWSKMAMAMAMVHETQKSIFKNEFSNLADFLNADSEAIIFG